MSSIRRSCATFAPGGAAVPAAREAVRQALSGWELPAGRVDDAVLIAGELMTNAVVHAGTMVEVGCRLDDSGERIRVEVRDLLPMRRLTDPDGAPPDTGRRGLAITQALSDEWGVTYTKTNKTVWFELALAGGAGAEPVGAGADTDGDPVALSGVLDPEMAPDQLFGQAARWLRSATGADAAYLLLSTEDGLRLRAAAEDAAEAGRQERAALAAQAAQALRVHEAPVTDAFGSVAGAAVQAGDRRLGLAVVTAAAAGRFGPADQAMLELIADVLAPAAAREQRAKARGGYRDWLGFLVEAGELLAATLDETPLVALAAQLFVPRIATWCAVYLQDDAKGAAPPLPAHVWHADEDKIGVLRDILKAAPRVPPAREPRPWPALHALAPPDRRICGPCLELPMVIRGDRLGTVLLGGPPGGDFRPDQVRLAEDLGRRFASALLNSRRYGQQVITSQILQRSLLPAALPPIPGIDYNIAYHPVGSGIEAGGDFYDVFRSGAGRWRFMLGDVCGTGPVAASMAGLARHTLRALSREGHDAAGALDRLNAAVYEESLLDDWPATNLLTLLHGELEPGPRGGVRLSLAAAGHPLPLLLDADGVVRPIGTSQLLLGAVAGPGYRLDTTELRPGELMLCVTDGVTERRRGARQLDDGEGLARLLSGCAGMTARAVTQRIQTATRDFTDEPLDDDTAIFALRIE